MSPQIVSEAHGNIGHMFARRNLPTAYGVQRAASGVETGETREVQDTVSLSPLAPRPLTMEFMEQAFSAGRSLGEGAGLQARTGDALREDRVFAAVSALALLGHSDDTPVSGWPAGIPAPSREELETARRRLAQRPHDTGDATNPEAVMRERSELLRAISKRDFSTVAFADAASA